MSKMNFSSEQLQAINAVDKNYLISAGAGSGKTAVLCERIYRLVKKERRLDNFLILTFTNLAASEMKQRIRTKLLEDNDTKEFAVEVDNSHIETFDSFYLFIARKYFYKLGISKDITIIDNAIIEIKRRQMVDQIFEELIVNKDKDIIELMRLFSLKNNDELKAFVLKILSASDNQTDKEKYFASLENDFKNENYINEVIKDYEAFIRKKISFLLNKIKEVDLINLEDIGNMNDYLYSLLAKESYDSLIEEIKNTSFPTKPKGQEENVEIRKGIASFYNKNIRLDYPSSSEIKEAINENCKHLGVVLRVVRQINRQIDEFKKKHNAYGFSDISRLVLKLFKDPEIVKEVKDQFDYIMVDEYQDTNDIQESVLNILDKNNVYMVGDIKQSIYRFRNADCEIFNTKFNDYKKHLGGEEIDLNKSFRSRMDVVNYINDLFSKLMVKEINPIDYKNGHNFGFGFVSYGKANPLYETEEYHYEYELSKDAVAKETRMIVNDMINKLNSGYMVYDHITHEDRPVSYKDFAIIIDRESEFDDFAKAISEAGIPLKSCGKEKLMTSDINVTIRNLVKLLYLALTNSYDNEYKHAYLSVARSFLIEESDQNLYETFKDLEVSKVLLTRLGQKIELLKEKLRFASLEEVMNTLFKEFSVYENIIKIGNYYANVHKAESLYRYASQMDALEMNLTDLVDYFDNLSNYELDIEYRDSDAQDDAVTLINIHQSKGLEYNIIYYPRLNRRFNLSSYQEKFNVSKRYGLLFPIKNLVSIELNNYLMQTADMEEKIRLLYVALTRAKQKIILYFGHKASKSISYYMPYKADSFLKIYDLASLGNKYVKEYVLGDELLTLNSKESSVIVPLKLEIKEIKVESEIKEKRRASKEVDKVDESLLRFGNEVHALLEGLDLSKKDTSYIKDYKFRRIANNVINSSLFKGVRNDQVRHEFSYYDKENNVNGVIDCLIIKDNEIDIIDFKLKNIAEEDYDKQLKTYKAYISSISDKPIKMYLLAALTGEVREVKDE